MKLSQKCCFSAAVRRVRVLRLIDIVAPDLDAGKLIAENDVQKYEFKAVMDRYLATIPNAPAKTLEAIYAGGRFKHPTLETFLKSAVAFTDGLSEADYKVRLDRDAKTRARPEELMNGNRLDAIVYPLQKRLVVPLTESNQSDRNGILASVTGFPAVTVPAGFSAPTGAAPLGGGREMNLPAPPLAPRVPPHKSAQALGCLSKERLTALPSTERSQFWYGSGV
jgi:amidase